MLLLFEWDLVLVCIVIELLDDDGYFCILLEELIDVVEFDLLVDMEEM